MPIKKSFLEQKWYFRVLRVFYLILPVIVAFVFLNGKINIPGISQKSTFDLLQKNIIYIIYAVTGLVIYYAAIPRIFFYLVFGGVEDDKKNSGQGAEPTAANKTALTPVLIILITIVVFILYETGYLRSIDLSSIKGHSYGASCTDSKGKTGLYGTDGNCYTCSNNGKAVTSPANNCLSGMAGVYCCGTGNNDGCIATGCSSMWYCSGSYYIGGQEIIVPGLCYPVHPRDVYSSWTGTCRQCP